MFWIIKQWVRKLPVSEKFSRDVLWNFGSLAVIGLVGISLNILILRVYGPGVLGVFNQVYAVYVLLSQLAVAGLQLAVGRYAAHYSEDPEQLSFIMTAAMAVTALISIFIIGVAVCCHPFIAKLFQSPAVAASLPLAFPALFLFSLNKVLFFFHNGCRRMKAYAFFQSLRFVSLLGVLIVLIALRMDGALAPIIFVVAEGMVFVALLGYSLRYFHFILDRRSLKWAGKLVRHGLQAMGGNMLYDVNTRVDVIMLGIFTSDRLVGVYSFVAMLLEGFHQIGFVFQSNVNPLLTRLRGQEDQAELKNLISQGRRLTYFFMVPLGFLALLGFPTVTRALNVSSSLDGYSAWSVLLILMTGSLLTIGYRPFYMLFNQAGFPAQQTGFYALTFLSNVLLNIVLIPSYGILGAALATATSWLLQVLYLKRFARAYLDLKL